jgi:hypothetical protein
MNFYELVQNMNAQPIVTNPQMDNRQTQAAAKSDDNEIVTGHEDKSAFTRVLNRISNKLGEKSNTYVPLLRYVAKNPRMLALFEQLIEETSKMQASTGRNVFNQ